jgi:hypothetical protein
VFAPILLALVVSQVPLDPIAALEREMESRPWTPPETTIPAEFVEAAKFMFAHGLADPSGGELRRVTIWYTESLGGNTTLVDSIGWVLPTLVSGRRVAVLLDGLLYPIVTATRPVTLQELVPDASSPVLADLMFVVPSVDPRRYYAAVALFLRAGDVVSAEALYSMRIGKLSGTPEVQFAAFVRETTSGRFHRALASHLSARDIASLRDSSSLMRHRADYEAVVTAADARLVREGEYVPLPQLVVAEALMADSLRRISETKAPLDMEHLRDHPIDLQIRRLIEHMDESQKSGAGVVQLVPEFYRIGDAAIPALLDVAKNDKRLTRSVLTPISRTRDRVLCTVRDLALRAIGAILENDELVRRQSGEDVVLKVESYWSKYGDIPRTERNYEVLADDGASPGEWITAAAWLSETVNIDRSHGGMSDSAWSPGMPEFALKGEAVRDGRSPGIVDLIADRVARVFKAESRDYPYLRAYNDAFRLGQSLFVWSPQDSLLTLQRLSHASIALVALSVPNTYINNLAYLTVARLRLGDLTAIQDYENAVKSLDGAQRIGARVEMFAPLFLFPEIKEFAELSESLFSSRESPWHPVHYWPAMGASEFATRLFLIPAFRREVLLLMDDETPVGTVSFDGRRFEYTTPNGKGTYGISKEEVETENMSVVGLMPLRRCDSVAFTVSRLPGAPKVYPTLGAAHVRARVDALREFIAENEGQLEKFYPEDDTLPTRSWMTNEPIVRR